MSFFCPLCFETEQPGRVRTNYSPSDTAVTDTAEERVEDILMSNRWRISHGTTDVRSSERKRGRNGYQLIRKQTAVCLTTLNSAGCRTNGRDAWQKIKTQPAHRHSQAPTPRQVKDKDWQLDPQAYSHNTEGYLEQSFNRRKKKPQIQYN